MSKELSVGMDNFQCIGCGLCANTAPTVFGLVEGVTFIRKSIARNESTENVNDPDTENTIHLSEAVIGANTAIQPDGTVNFSNRSEMFGGTRILNHKEVDLVIRAATECPSEAIYIQETTS